jgi:hypothetical protein
VRVRAPERRRASKPWGWARRGALAAAGLVLLGAFATGTGYVEAPVSVLDPGAWLVRGSDLVHASATTSVADWLIPDALSDRGVRTAQDGDRTVVVDPQAGKAFTIDPVNLEITGTTAVDVTAVPLVRGDTVYLVSDGAVRWLDPGTLEPKGTVAIPGRGDAALTGDGDLWVHTPRDGMIRRIREGRVTLEVPHSTPGRTLELALAADRPVTFDGASRTLTWIDPSDGQPAHQVTLPLTGTLQGDSPHGPRAWIAAPEAGRLVGVAPDGATIEVDVAHRPLLRPEATADHVFAPAGDGTVTVVDARTGTTRPHTPLPAAREPDFTMFVKDGRIWYSAPSRRDSGNIGTDGTATPIHEDRASLVAANDAPKPNEVAVPAAAPAEGPPVSAPTGRPPEPSRPPSGTLPPTPPTAPVPTTTLPRRPSTTPAPTTTTTLPSTVRRETVPSLVGLTPAAACKALEDAGLKCRQQSTGTYGPDNHVERQSAAQGTRLPAGATVTITHGQKGIQVPNLVGQTREDACAALRQRKLGCNATPAASPTAVKPQAVWRQSTAANTWVGEGQTVTVTHDNVVWEPLVQCDATGENDWHLTVNRGGGCPGGWKETRVGLIARTQAPGTVPLYKYIPNGAGQNQSELATTLRNDSLQYYSFHSVMGYVLTGYSPTFVYEFTGNSERYYSLNQNDPAGAPYLARDPHNLGPVWRTW